MLLPLSHWIHGRVVEADLATARLEASVSSAVEYTAYTPSQPTHCLETLTHMLKKFIGVCIITTLGARLQVIKTWTVERPGNMRLVCRFCFSVYQVQDRVHNPVHGPVQSPGIVPTQILKDIC